MLNFNQTYVHIDFGICCYILYIKISYFSTINYKSPIFVDLYDHPTLCMLTKLYSLQDFITLPGGFFNLRFLNLEVVG